jgi:hypothetical protein
MTKNRILSIGQCAADHGSLTWAFRKHFDAEVVGADSEAEGRELLKQGPFALILVNRLLDADGSSGLEIVQHLVAEKVGPVMLVSNYEEAQREAVQAGAVPGFGKAALGQPGMVLLVRNALASNLG